MIALPIYYPYDLMKTRMQTTDVKNMYNNLFDAFVKTYAEDLHRSEPGYERAYTKKRKTIRERLGESMTRMRRFYTGMSIYGGTYVTFIAIEFSLYETCLREIETRCEGQSLFSHCLEHVRSLTFVRDYIEFYVKELMNKAYAEEVDENNIV